MKVAVVGLQAMGRHHLTEIQKLSLVTQVAGCDLNATLRKNAGESLGIETFADVPSLLHDFNPDAVFVVTAPNRHAEVIDACLERKIATLTEKPICHNWLESQRIVHAAQKLGVPLQVGFELRYSGTLKAVASLVRDGTVGKLSHISLTQYPGPHDPQYFSRERTGGLFYEKLCHQIDTFRYFLGEPVRCMAVAAPKIIYNMEDNVMAVFQFADGALGTIKFDSRRAAQINGLAPASPAFEGRDAGHFYEFLFTGDRGSAIYDAWTECMDVVRFNHRPDCKNELARRIHIREEFGEPAYAIGPQDADFLQRVAGRQSLQFPATDALETMRWVELAEQSLRQGGQWLSP